MYFCGGVAWSNGQHRRLPLQGSRDRIPVFPFSFIIFLAMQKRKSTKVSRKKKEKMKGQRRSGKLEEEKTGRRFRNDAERFGSSQQLD